MQLRITIQMDNAAFDDEYEICNVLARAAAGVIRRESDCGHINDTNGNMVGAWLVTNEDD